MSLFGDFLKLKFFKDSVEVIKCIRNGSWWFVMAIAGTDFPLEPKETTIKIIYKLVFYSINVYIILKMTFT